MPLLSLNMNDVVFIPYFAGQKTPLKKVEFCSQTQSTKALLIFFLSHYRCDTMGTSCFASQEAPLGTIKFSILFVV